MSFGRLFPEVRRGRRRETIDIRGEDLFEILANSRRRAVIEHVADGSPDPMTCESLAVAIAADETHMDSAVVPPRRVQPVEDALRAEHLPRLAAVELVQWDADTDTIRSGHSVDAVARLLGEIGHRVRRKPVLPSSPFQAGGPDEPWGPPSDAQQPTLPDADRDPR